MLKTTDIYAYFISCAIYIAFLFKFPNRYVEEHVQKTGVAIETQGFSLVTSGKKRESLTVN